MTATQIRFLIVDDDPHNNTLSKIALRKSLGEVEVIDFILPEKGLEFIQSNLFSNPDGEKTVLFLDINMPSMSGWEFLDKLESMGDRIKSLFDIYILSSSIDRRDLQRAKENSLIIDFIEKPLGKNKLLEMFS